MSRVIGACLLLFLFTVAFFTVEALVLTAKISYAGTRIKETLTYTPNYKGRHRAYA